MEQISKDKLLQIMEQFVCQIKTDLQTAEGITPPEAEEELHLQLLIAGYKAVDSLDQARSVWFKTEELLQQIQRGIDTKILAENLANLGGFAILPIVR